MRELRTCRSLASLTLGLLCLLLFELPALAYPWDRASAEETVAAAPAVADAGSRFVRCSPLQLRRSMRVAAAADTSAAAAPGKWVPTLPEGAVFTAIGAGLILGGGIVLGVGMARFFPLVLDASGLVTEANQPMILMGIGFTLLLTGIAFLVHGVEVLRAVREAEAAAAASAAARLEMDPRPWSAAWTPSAPDPGATAGVTLAF